MATPIFDEIPPDAPPARPNHDETNFAALLSRVYRIADQTVTDLEICSDDKRMRALGHKVASLTKLAKVLPLLQQAEQNAAVRDTKGKDLKDWSTDELRAEVARMQSDK